VEIGVVISDPHVGSYAGLCPPSGIRLDGGGIYKPNKFQLGTYRLWLHFWEKFVPSLAPHGRKLKFIVINGDALEGLHHNRTGIVATTWEDMVKAAAQILQPLTQMTKNLFIIRGTEAHSAPMAEAEENLAQKLGAIQNEVGDWSHWQLWLEAEGVQFQFAHHIGVTSSAAYETSAPMRELVAGLVESAQWGRPMPKIIVRSHRHRYTRVPLPTADGDIELVVTPGWQLRTPHVERIDRMRMPHIGGVAFIMENGECEVKRKVYPLPDPKIIKL